MIVLISYDITNDKVRTKLAHRLKDFGPRVQFSVFEADMEAKECEKLYQVLSKVNLGKGDSIRLYHLCEACQTKVRFWGVGELSRDKDYYIA